MKRNLSAVVRIGKRMRAIRIQRIVRGWLARRELHRRMEAFRARYRDWNIRCYSTVGFARLELTRWHSAFACLES